MTRDPEQKIARPRQLYVGPALRDFVPLAKRDADAGDLP
jgi:citrate synthase